MPRTAAFAVENAFNKGILTEFTGLNFPEQACTDALNVIFDNKGAVLRRTGLDLEGSTFQTHPAEMTPTDNLAYNSFLWNSAGSVSGVSFMVLQIGYFVLIQKISTNSLVNTAAPVFQIRLADYNAPGPNNDFNTLKATFSQGGGNLFITHPYTSPLVVSYNVSTGAFSVTVQVIRIRDFKGVEDGLRGSNVAVRPNTLSPEHRYNLYNQGWQDPPSSLDLWDKDRSDWPSNADFWVMFKGADPEFPTPYFQTKLIKTTTAGTTPAPRGHFIYDAFNIDRSNAAGFGGLPTESSGYQRPSCSAFFAGRAFWSGVNFKDYSNQIYFSQIVIDGSDYGACYQRNDPTTDQQTDLLSNDGGVIKILEAGRIVALVPIASSLVVIASNGVWAISGSQGIGFTATDYSVVKVSGIGTNYPNSIVDAVGTPLFWNEDGIYTIGQSQLGDFQVTSITETTIKSMYQELAPTALPIVSGAFSLNNREVVWMWDSGTTTEFLQLRVANGSFSRWSVGRQIHPGQGELRPMSIAGLYGFAQSQFTDIVTAADGSNVFTSAGTVTVDGFGTSPLASSFKILTRIRGTRFYNFLDFNSGAFQDFATYGGVNYDSYFVSGYKIRGDAIRKFQMNYVQFFTDLSEFPNGSCYVSSVWDYNTRYSNSQQIYPLPGQQTTGRTRKQIRGTGEAVQFLFESEDDKPFHVIGWSEFVTGNQGV